MINKKVAVLLLSVGIGIVALAFIFKGSVTTTTSTTTKELTVGTDICSEFPKEFVSTILGKAILSTEEHHSQTTNTCAYYVDKTDFVTLRANTSSVQKQKEGQIALGRATTVNPNIKMEHLVVMQKPGVINEIILVLNSNSFIAIDRSSTNAASETELVTLASKISEKILEGTNNVTTTSPTPTNQADVEVPLPSDEDVLRTFFNLINEARISDAVNMLSTKTIADDAQKQAWGVQFNAFKQISVKSMEPVGTNQYKVVLDIVMKPESANAPIPYYGYDNGQNVRWVSFEKDNGQIRILGISTGP